MVVLEPVDDTAEALAALHQAVELDAGEMAGVGFEILRRSQGTVEAGRADFENVGLLDGVFHFEGGGEGTRELRAVLDLHLPVGGALGHDLERGTLAALDTQAHDAVAHVVGYGLDDIEHARVHGCFRLEAVGHSSPWSSSPTKKALPGESRVSGSNCSPHIGAFAGFVEGAAH